MREQAQRRLDMLQWELGALPERMSEARKQGNEQRLVELQRLSQLLPQRIDQQRQMIAKRLLGGEV